MAKKTVSQRRIDANRANARKSTGPRTPDGKAVASRNATKHGLLAQQLILEDDPVESESAFQTLLIGLNASFEPEGPFEHLLVERIAVCYWRLARATRFEARSIRTDREDEYAPWAELRRSVTGKPADPSRHIIPVCACLDHLVRYEGLIDRELHRAISHFRRVRADRLALSPPSAATVPTADPAREPSPDREKTIPNEPNESAFSTAPTATEVPLA